MGSITLNKPSGGQLTLSPEDGATNETVTIPADGIMKGGIVNYEFLRTGTWFNTASSGYSDSPVSVTINKKYADSYIVIEASPVVQVYASGSAEARAYIRLNCPQSNYTNDYNQGMRAYDGANPSHVVMAPIHLQGIDTTNLTGNLTYTVQLALQSGVDVRLNLDGDNQAYSSIHVYEVKQ